MYKFSGLRGNGLEFDHVSSSKELLENYCENRISLIVASRALNANVSSHVHPDQIREFINRMDELVGLSEVRSVNEMAALER